MMSIEEIYNAYKQEIFYYLISLTHDPILAEDLLSDTFVNAIKSISRFRGDSSIKTWLFSIARNLWLQNLRKTKATETEYSELLTTYISESTEEQVIKRQTADRVCALLREKDERTRTVVKMRIDGFSYYEISQRLSISESSARVIDFRTKKWIRAVLEKEGLL